MALKRKGCGCSSVSGFQLGGKRKTVSKKTKKSRKTRKSKKSRKSRKTKRK